MMFNSEQLPDLIQISATVTSIRESLQKAKLCLLFKQIVEFSKQNLH